MANKKTTVLVFAGPNGSGKSTVTSMIKPIGTYINADMIKQATHCDDLAAAIEAEKLRNQCLEQNKDFTFETVLSTTRNLDLLKRAKEKGYFIKCIFVLTANPQVNLERVKERVLTGGHDVPKDKILSRYHKSLALLPELISVCDVCNVIDNTKEPCRIFSKKNGVNRLWENEFWKEAQIKELTRQSDFVETHKYAPSFDSPILIKVNSMEQVKAISNAGIRIQAAKTNEGIIIARIDKKDALQVRKLLAKNRSVKPEL